MSSARAMRPCLTLLVLALALIAPAAAQAKTPERTGRLLVTLDNPKHEVGVRAAAAAVLDRKDVRRDGFQVPQINLVSVRPIGGIALSALAQHPAPRARRALGRRRAPRLAALRCPTTPR